MITNGNILDLQFQGFSAIIYTNAPKHIKLSDFNLILEFDNVYCGWIAQNIQTMVEPPPPPPP